MRKPAYDNNFKIADFKLEQDFYFTFKVDQSSHYLVPVTVHFFDKRVIFACLDEVLFVGPKRVTVDNIEKCYKNILAVVSDELFKVLLDNGYIVRR